MVNLECIISLYNIRQVNVNKKLKNDDDELRLEDCQNFEFIIERSKQLSLPINIPTPYMAYEEDNAIIYQRIEDGYVNATAMCKAAGKLMGHYKELDATKEFIQALSSDIGKTIRDIIVTQIGGESHLKGTWIHPDLAVHLAMWLSPKFAVKVARWVNDWRNGKIRQSHTPYHIKRWQMNEHAVPIGHFSILQEMGLRVFSKFENEGYFLPSHLVPDISAGRMFAGWLRKQGVDVDKMPTYMHRYMDGRLVQAKAYPMALFTAFHAHLNKVWIPKKSYKYFAERDKAALPYLNKLLDSYSNPIRLTPIGDGSCK
jgi:hypothetical protein